MNKVLRQGIIKECSFTIYLHMKRAIHPEGNSEFDTSHLKNKVTLHSNELLQPICQLQSEKPDHSKLKFRICNYFWSFKFGGSFDMANDR